MTDQAVLTVAVIVAVAGWLGIWAHAYIGGEVGSHR